MTTSAPFLSTPYSGYLHNNVPREDPELTHTGPGTPAGEWFRRFWQPVALSAELKDLPMAIRILDEDLVVFRDRSGQVGLLELHCSHRGTSLEFAQIEERGIRCCYHAWLYDVDGKLLETPGEPAESTLTDRLYHGAYPTLEHQGVVFAYMGPREKQPPFPILDTYDMPGYRAQPRTHEAWPCNWLQVRENAMDPVHLRFLHTIEGNVGFTSDFTMESELDFMETPVGMVYIDTRRVKDTVWVRVSDMVLPTIHQGCDLGQDLEGRDGNRPTISIWIVPVDDTHTTQFGFFRVRDGEEFRTVDTFGQTPERLYEDRQHTPGDYDVMVSQRSIEIHALEHLASTDRGVIMLRNMVRHGIHAVQKGEDPPGVFYKNGGVIFTYSIERLLPIPPAPTPEEDQRLLRETGRKVVEDRIKELS